MRRLLVWRRLVNETHDGADKAPMLRLEECRDSPSGGSGALTRF